MELEINNHLSLYGNERVYVDQLRDDLNFLVANQRFHHALNIYHLLFMVFIYQILLKSRIWRPRKFRGALIGFNHRDLRRDEVLTTTSAFTFSKINERSVVDYLAIFDAKSDCISQCKELVDQRNERCHANGIFLDNERNFTEKTDLYDELAKEVQSKTAKYITQPLQEFSRSFPKGYTLTKNDIELSLIQPNYLSYSDLQRIEKSIKGTKTATHQQIKRILKEDFGV